LALSLYDPIAPRNSIDLLTEIVLNSHHTVFCHFFMECGKKATKQIDFNGKLINVCENHFEETKKSEKAKSEN